MTISIENSFSILLQVFISDYFGGDIFIGPHNVMFVNDKIKEDYIDDLNYEVDSMKWVRSIFNRQFDSQQ